MKYVIIQGDGMADRPIPELGGRTPLEAVQTPNLDRMASRGILGMTPTIPKGMAPASDVGAMSVLGYDPRQYRTGGSALAAASLGVALGADDVAFRCHLVSIGSVDGVETMEDFAAGHLSSAEASALIAALGSHLGDPGIELHAGVSYRHLLVWRGGLADMRTTAPHGIAGKGIAEQLPTGVGAERLRDLMQRSRAVLDAHPVNLARRARGERVATQVWLWDQGKRVQVPTLKERFGLDGAVIAAVDLVNGLGVLAGLHRVDVPGITGYVDTDYAAKAECGLKALADHNFLLLHVAAPDEAGHMGDAAEKVKAIEAIDALVLGRLLAGLPQFGDWRLMVLPAHPTPCALMTHTGEPVPFAVFSSSDLDKTKGPSRRYSESDARDQGIFIPEAHTLLERLLHR